MQSIKDARLQYGLTQAQMSQLTGIPKRTIESWEEGKRQCPPYVESMLLETLRAPGYRDLLSKILADLEQILQTGSTDQLAEVIDQIKNFLKKSSETP